MLEIKGRTGTLRLSDVRELDQWVRDARDEEEWDSKGLLIANLKNTLPPNLREEIYPPNCNRAATNRGICLLSTPQLFLAIQQMQRELLNIESFWDEIFNTDGICKLPELE